MKKKTLYNFSEMIGNMLSNVQESSQLQCFKLWPITRDGPASYLSLMLQKISRDMTLLSLNY